MRNAEQSPDQPSDRTRVMAAYRWPTSEAGTGRIRYAHGGLEEFEGQAWSARFPVARRQNDLWILVCGGIAAVAAFAAAFVAAGGVPGHPATPSAVPAVVSQACPSPGTGSAP